MESLPDPTREPDAFGAADASRRMLFDRGSLLPSESTIHEHVNEPLDLGAPHEAAPPGAPGAFP